MIKIWLIRHGMTEGNRHQRYIGVTDEPLCPEGIERLKNITYPKPQAIFVSPLRRCQETAEILFPEQKVRIIDQLAECDFGAFENKNYKELSDDPRYQAWIDSNGIMAFPGGESKEECAARNLEGFQRAVTTCIRENISEAALVVHGGTIMNIMEAYALPKKDFMSGMSVMAAAIWWNWSRPSGRKTGESFRCWRQEINSNIMTFQITEFMLY